MKKFAVYLNDEIVAKGDAFEVLPGGVLKVWEEVVIPLGSYFKPDSVMLFPAGYWTYADFVEVD